jgi:hypothetical protein
MSSNPSSGIDTSLLTEPVAGAPLHPLQNDGDRPLPRLAVVLATLGRPDVVNATLDYLLKTQNLKPAAVIVSCVAREDAGNAANLPSVTVVTGPPGLAKQRNAALAALPAGILWRMPTGWPRQLGPSAMNRRWYASRVA